MAGDVEAVALLGSQEDRTSAVGKHVTDIAKLAGIFKLSVQDVGDLQTGRTTEEFQDFLQSQA